MAEPSSQVRDKLSLWSESPVFVALDGALFRNLRSLTMVRLPQQEDRIIPGGLRTRAAIFRHFDPGTVAITLPAMTLPQRARLFGPAQSLLIDAPEGVLEAKRRPDWPQPEIGRLSFSHTSQSLRPLV